MHTRVDRMGRMYAAAIVLGFGFPVRGAAVDVVQPHEDSASPPASFAQQLVLPTTRREDLAAPAKRAEPKAALVFLGLEELATRILDFAPDIADSTPVVLEGLEPRVSAFRSGADFVAVLDENASGGEPDELADLYLVDYDSDGTFDRLVDWEDTDGDGRADRQILLALTGGGPEANRLSGFFIEQHDEERDFWYLSRWHYVQATSQFHCDFSGDVFFAAIHLDRYQKRWEAFDESMFAFYDPDGDGLTEEAVRVAGTGVSVDAVRWSFDLDEDAGTARPGTSDTAPPDGVARGHTTLDMDPESSPYDYDLSISTDGRVLLNAAVMETVIVVGRELPLFRRSETRDWTAQQSWRRALLTIDENDANHDPADPGRKERWEGIIAEDPGGFPYAGGPSCGQINKRYELRTTPGPIALYYSAVDGRIHLRGAERGWLDVDLNDDFVREARLEMQDTNADGFFDTWNWDANADGVFESAYTAPEPAAESISLDGQTLRALEIRIREENGGLSQEERFRRDIARWVEAGRFVPRTE